MAVTARKRSAPQSFLANCQASDAVGDLVYVSDDMVGGLYTVMKVDYEDRAKMPAMGMIVAKIDDTACMVQVQGEVRDLYTGLTPGRYCFIGNGARLTQVVPSTPDVGVRYSQPAAYALASNTLLLRMELPTVRTAN